MICGVLRSNHQRVLLAITGDEKMQFVHNPNIPAKPVSVALADGRIGKQLEDKFTQLGIQIIKTEKYEGLYDAISYHPDILFHHIGGNRIVYAPGGSIKVIKRLQGFGFELVPGETRLQGKYPFNIAYNIARVGKLAFHNLKYTDPIVVKELELNGVELVHVNQGYTKCSVSVVNDSSIITSDSGIAITAVKKRLEVLLIEPEEGILLPGLNYGFIGGSSGLIGEKKWMISGDLLSLKSGQKIIQFLRERCIDIVPLPSEPVIDIGSIIPLMTSE